MFKIFLRTVWKHTCERLIEILDLSFHGMNPMKFIKNYIEELK